MAFDEPLFSKWPLQRRRRTAVAPFRRHRQPGPQDKKAYFVTLGPAIHAMVRKRKRVWFEKAPRKSQRFDRRRTQGALPIVPPAMVATALVEESLAAEANKRVQTTASLQESASATALITEKASATAVATENASATGRALEKLAATTLLVVLIWP